MKVRELIRKFRVVTHNGDAVRRVIKRRDVMEIEDNDISAGKDSFNLFPGAEPGDCSGSADLDSRPFQVPCCKSASAINPQQSAPVFRYGCNVLETMLQFLNDASL